MACAGTPLHTVRLNWVGKHSGSKTLVGARGREACGIPSGCCKDSFNLSIPPCPQQLLKTEGFKTPRAETHKSRLGWNKKEEEMRGRTTGTIFHHKYGTWQRPGCYSAEAPSIIHAERRVPGWSRDTGVQCGPSPCTGSSLTTGCLSASFSKCHDWVCFALLCCVRKRTAQNIHVLSRTAECRLQTQRE